MSAIDDALRAAGWTPWHGGECPVDPYSFPIVLTADGSTDCERATDFDWGHDPDTAHPGDVVIAYRSSD